eukprot:TRINITY_DN2459_c0_g2_i1.p1 TRINITY_DN2459_c0_g2~~TRINITY_DN2459_c0_g2_i1.p1  ORF type:complete len:2380 (+),score=707.76 TRINITY_DN2459_c0_g2_i1:93-7142(+)
MSTAVQGSLSAARGAVQQGDDAQILSDLEHGVADAQRRLQSGDDADSHELRAVAQAAVRLASQATAEGRRLHEKLQTCRDLVDRNQVLVSRGLVGDAGDDGGRLQEAEKRVRELEEDNGALRQQIADLEHQLRCLEQAPGRQQRELRVEELTILRKETLSVCAGLLQLPALAPHAERGGGAPGEDSPLQQLHTLDAAVRGLASAAVGSPRSPHGRPPRSPSASPRAGELGELRRRAEAAEGRVSEVERQQGNVQRAVRSALDLLRGCESEGLQFSRESLEFAGEAAQRFGPPGGDIQLLQRGVRKLVTDWKRIRAEGPSTLGEAPSGSLTQHISSLEAAIAELDGRGPAPPDTAEDAAARVAECTRYLSAFAQDQGRVLRTAARAAARAVADAGMAEDDSFAVPGEGLPLGDLVSGVCEQGGMVPRLCSALGQSCRRETQLERRLTAAGHHAERLAVTLGGGERQGLELEEALTQALVLAQEMRQNMDDSAGERMGAEDAMRQLSSVDGLLLKLLAEAGMPSSPRVQRLDAQAKALQLGSKIGELRGAVRENAFALADATASFARIASGDRASEDVGMAEPEEMRRWARAAEDAVQALRDREVRLTVTRRPPPTPPGSEAADAPHHPLPLSPPRAAPEGSRQLQRAAAAAASAVASVPTAGGADEHRAAEAERQLRKYKRRVRQLVDVLPSPLPRSPPPRSPSHSPSDGRSPARSSFSGLDALEAAVAAAAARRAPGTSADSVDAQLNAAADELLTLLPAAEAAVGAPAQWDRLELGRGSAPPAGRGSGAERLQETVSRWRRVGESYSAVQQGLDAVGRGIPPQVRHCCLKLRAALSRCGVRCDVPPLDTATTAPFLAALDTITETFCQWADRSHKEHEKHMSIFETISAAAGSPPGYSGGGSTPADVVHKVEALCKHCSGVEARLDRLTRTTLSAAQQVSQVLGGSDGGRRPAPRAADVIPECALQDAVDRLSRRAQRLQQQQRGGLPEQSRDVSPPREALERLQRLAPGATGDRIDAVAHRIEELEQERAAAKRECERMSQRWRKLHNEVMRRLRPLLHSVLATPDGCEPREMYSAEDIVTEVERRVKDEHNRLDKSVSERDGQRLQNHDLKQRLSALQRQYASGATQVRRVCEAVGISALPAAGPAAATGIPGRSTGCPACCDVAESSRIAADAVVQMKQRLEATEATSVQAARDRAETELERGRLARVEYEHQHLRAFIRGSLDALQLLPSLPDRQHRALHGAGASGDEAEWAALCTGMDLLASEVQRATRAESRIQRCDAIVDRLLAELAGAICLPVSPGGDGRLGPCASPSPHPPAATGPPPIAPAPAVRSSSGTSSEDAGSWVLSPSRPLPSPPHRGRRVAPGDHADGQVAEMVRPDSPPLPDRALERRCEDVMYRVRHLRAAAEVGQRKEEELRTVGEALRRVAALAAPPDDRCPSPSSQHSGHYSLGPSGGAIAAAEALAAGVGRLRGELRTAQEASATATKEKARLVREVCDLKAAAARAEALAEETALLRDALDRAEEERAKMSAREGELREQGAAAARFAQCARRMLQPQRSGEEGEEDGDIDSAYWLRAEHAERALQVFHAMQEKADESARGAELATEALSGVAAKLGRMITEADRAQSTIAGGDAGASDTPPSPPPAGGVAAVHALCVALQERVRALAEATAHAAHQAGRILHYLRGAAQTLAPSAGNGGGVDSPPRADSPPALAAVMGLIEKVSNALLTEAGSVAAERGAMSPAAAQPRQAPAALTPALDAPADGPAGELAAQHLHSAVELLEGILGAPGADLQEESDDYSSASSGFYGQGRRRERPPRRLSAAALAPRCAALAAAVDADLRILCRAAQPDRGGVLAALRRIVGGGVSPPRSQPWGEPHELAQLLGGVREVVGQLHQLASGIQGAPAKECARLLMQTTRRRRQPQVPGFPAPEEHDPLGLVHALRRLLAVISNKVRDAAPRDSAEVRSQMDALRSENKRLEELVRRKELNAQAAQEQEKATAGLLGVNRDQWAAARKRLEARVQSAESELQGLRRAKDEAQSELAQRRCQLAELRRRYPQIAAELAEEVGNLPTSPLRIHPHSPTSPPAASPPGEGGAVAELERRLAQAEAACEKHRQYAASLMERLESREAKYRQCKERLRQVEQELRERELRQREAFQQQLEEVKKDVIRVSRGGVAWGAASQPCSQQQQPAAVSRSPSVPPRLPSASTNGGRSLMEWPSRAQRSPSAPPSRAWDGGAPTAAASSSRLSPARSRRSAGQSVHASITVPVEFSLSRSRGRTGCFCCDSPEGPTHYGGATSPRSAGSLGLSRQPRPRARDHSQPEVVPVFDPSLLEDQENRLPV